MNASTVAIMGVWLAFVVSLVSGKITNQGSLVLFFTAVGMSVYLGP